MKARLALVVTSLVLSVLIGLALSRGASMGGDRERPLIGFAMDTLKEARWQRDRDAFVARCEELGADVLVQSANSDDTRQMQDVQSLVSRDVDVLVLVPHNGAAMAKAVRVAHDAGIPVMAYDRLIPDCDLDFYITFDNVRVGEMQAEYLVSKIPPDRTWRIVRIYGANTDHNATLFKEGQDLVLAPYVADGRIEVVHEDWAENWKPEQAKKITNAAITRHGRDIDAVLASNDGTAGGAIQALLEEGLAGRVLVTGQDAELVACQRIVAGTQAMTIYKPLRDVARRAAEIAVRIAERRPVFAAKSVDNGRVQVPAELLGVVAVDRDNLRETVVASGFHPADDVYRDVPPDARPGSGSSTP